MKQYKLCDCGFYWDKEIQEGEIKWVETIT